MRPSDDDDRHDADRGWSVAHERLAFYERLRRWAERYEIRSMLEGPLDGARGVRGVHGAGLARTGIAVTSWVRSAHDADRARAVFEASGGGAHATVEVVAGGIAEGAPLHDLVLAYDATSLAPDWPSYLHALASLARKVLVVVAPNARGWRARAGAVTRWVPSLEGAPARRDDGDTRDLAPELWKLGRVREHDCFDATTPWAALRASLGKAPRRERFTYGPARWPYFGGAGWVDELLPMISNDPEIVRHDATVSPAWASHHAFLVDVRPRTPQARRRLVPAPDS